MPLAGGQVLGKATQNQLKPRSEGFLSEDRNINRPTFPSDIGGTRRGFYKKKMRCNRTHLIRQILAIDGIEKISI